MLACTLWRASGHELNPWVPQSSTRCTPLVTALYSGDQNYTLKSIFIDEFQPVKASLNVLPRCFRQGLIVGSLQKPLVSHYSSSFCAANNTTSCAISLTTFPVSGPTSPAITSSLCNLYFHPNEAGLSNLREDSPN